MVKFKNFLWSAGLMAATTVGAGMFSLPYVFQKAGWFTGFFYLIVLAGFVVVAHNLYWETLEKFGEKKRLLGLVKTYFGKISYRLSLGIVLGGLTLALVIYLIIVERFTGLIFPALGSWGPAIFWIIASLPILLKLPRLIFSELLGGILMLLVVLIIFLTTSDFFRIFSLAPTVDFQNLFLPFGALIFSLTGWTAVEPIFEYERKSARDSSRGRRAMALGTTLAALFYLAFTVAVFGSGATITVDTVSGLLGWPFWKITAVVLLGLFAIWTSYVPIGLEIKNSLEKDLGWPSTLGAAFVFLVPPALVLLGLRDFLKILGLAGGVFLGLQYLLIILVGRKALSMTSRKQAVVNLLALVFAAAAVYEIYYFVIN